MLQRNVDARNQNIKTLIIQNRILVMSENFEVSPATSASGFFEDLSRQLLGTTNFLPRKCSRMAAILLIQLTTGTVRSPPSSDKVTVQLVTMSHPM